MQRLPTEGYDAGRTGARGPGFARSEDGSLIIFGLMIFLMMLMAAGIGVDLMRFEAHRTALQETLDRAILAAASLDQPLDPETVVLDYFERANLGDYISADKITVEETASSRRVSAEVSMPVTATFMKFVGIDALSAPAAGAAEEATANTEISLVLDVSGSMGWYSSGRSKISILKDAATQFVNITTCNPADPDATTGCTVDPGTVSISIVPYSEQVLVGEDLLSHFNVTSEHTSSSCVTFDDADFETTAIAPETPLKRTGHFDPWSWSATPYYFTCANESWREILPIEGDGDVLRAKIAALSAEGNTSIDVGMKWGAALLDPAAQPAVTDVVDSDFADRPLSWETRGVEKVLVLMTDGENTDQHYLYDNARSGPSPVWRTNARVGGDYVYSIYRESTGQYYWTSTGSWEDHPYGTGTYESCGWQRHGRSWNWVCSTVNEGGNGASQLSFPDLWAERTWAWWEQFWWLDAEGSYFDTSTKNARLESMCDAAKAEGITIYTIGFETSSSAETVLRNCASGEGRYFNVDGLDLTDAFASIARDISKLRLVN
ncbi:MAG: hypothetical protein D6801_06505 [Alphaproteobacteria bacterium]|nr:MAG: hypothetical protein D6801_06505 [Alphaproteobacteria bacterium]